MSFNISLSGLNAAQKDLDVTGNNIANSSTIGFKQSRAEFADVFSEKFYGKPQEFIDFICDKEFAVEGSYVETWNFIKQDTHSLKRYTNFQLFFDEDK